VGEGIPQSAHAKSQDAARRSGVMVVVGSTEEVYPAALAPRWASEVGANIVEINLDASDFTGTLNDMHISLPAAKVFRHLEK